MEKAKIGFITALVIFLAILGMPVVVSADGGDTSLVHACVNPSGVAKIITPDGTCSNSETPVHWSSAAPRTVPAIFTVDCNAGETIGGKLKDLIPGDILLVSGVCNENVVIREEVHRITLDGQGTATISGPNAGISTVDVRGTGITIKGFTITGGRNGIILNGGSALIDGNTIHGVGSNGINVNRNSSADIKNNTIENNLNTLDAAGIFVNNHSFAAIGFERAPGTVISRSNTIRNNRFGIRVSGSSYAKIFGNTISSNTKDGVFVFESTRAEVFSNTIGGNSEDAIEIRENSSARLGSIPEEANIGENAGFGVRCSLGGHVSGFMGTLDGGAVSFSDGCINNLSP